MRFDFDREADAIYIWLRDLPYAYGEDLDDERRIDYGPDGNPIGIELLNVSAGVRIHDLPHAHEVQRLLDNQHVRVLA